MYVVHKELEDPLSFLFAIPYSFSKCKTPKRPRLGKLPCAAEFMWMFAVLCCSNPTQKSVQIAVV